MWHSKYYTKTKKIRITLLGLLILKSSFIYAVNEKDRIVDISIHQFFDNGIDKGLQCGEYKLILKEGRTGFGVVLMNGEEETFYQNNPVQIIVGNTPDMSGETITEKEYAKGYDYLFIVNDTIYAITEVTTEKGSVFSVEDKYTLLKNGVFGISRCVIVVEAGEGETGFASAVSLNSCLDSSINSDYEYFIPSILYRNSAEMKRGAIASDPQVERMLVKETRTGLPLIMLREKERENVLTLMHYKPVISIGQHPGGGVPGEVNDELQYGAIGYTRTPSLSVVFHYPCSEGPVRYDRDYRIEIPESDWSDKYHSIKAGNSHYYTVGLIPDRTIHYNDAVVNAYSVAYSLQEPMIVDMDMKQIYEQNIALFKAEYREYGTGKIKAAGVPWSLDLPDGDNREGVSFQMGFVGQQIPVGYHLYRYGIKNNDPEAKQMGKRILDFWVSDPIMKTYFPTVWWDPADNSTAGQRRDYPSFLRCFVDGMEGLLDAYRFSVASGEPQKKWNKALQQVALNLVKKQNEDGSFYRAYKTNGEVEIDFDRNTDGMSKLNTPIAVRFLVKMYEHTGEDIYRDAAVRAAEFSYNEIYLKLGKYVGGTPDNPNTVDKEAAVFAFYCFNAIHELTKDPKYLKAAEHAAICAMSWVYCYDFALPNRNEEDARKNPFTKGGVSGFSIIATGHSGADNYISYMFYEMYKLYVKTGNDLYLHMAKLLQNNTKSNTDFDGRMGYKYPAFMPEATNVADLAFRSVSVWLPWASIANIEPIIYLEEAFGVKDIFLIKRSLPELRELLYSNGVGGKPFKRNK